MKISLKKRNQYHENSRFSRIQKLIRCIFSEPQRFLKRLCVVTGVVLAISAGTALDIRADETEDWDLKGKDYYHDSVKIDKIWLTDDDDDADDDTDCYDNILNAARFSASGVSMTIDKDHSFTGLEADSSLLLKALENNGAVQNLSEINILAALTNGSTGEINGNGGNTALITGGKIDNQGAIANFVRVQSDAGITNGGTIGGMGADSVFTAGGALDNSGKITQFTDVTVKGGVTNSADAAISGTGRYSTLKTEGKLTNDGAIGDFSDIEVAGKVTNNAKGTITGTGDNSNLNAASIENNADAAITNYSHMNVADTVANSGTITASGEGSAYKLGKLTNLTSGSKVEKVESLVVTGDITNNGSIDGTGANSKLNAANLTNNTGAVITNYSNMDVTGTVTNAADALTRATGAGSAYNMGQLNNSGTVDQLESLVVAGAITNQATGKIIEVGANSTVKAASITNNGIIATTTDRDTDPSMGIYSSIDVTGDLVNAGINPNQTLTEWTAEQHPDLGPDRREFKRPDIPAKQSIVDDIAGAALIANYSNMSVGGKLTNSASGYIQGTGVGSTASFGTLENSGVMTRIEHMDVTGKLTNYGGGLIQGTGVGSTMNVGDTLNINYGSTIRGYETVNVGGDLYNYGAMEFVADTYVGGDFLNQSNTYVAGSRQAGGMSNDTANAVGGMLVTDTYDGRIGKITVQGDATINGGELWIGGSGEQLRVGQDYVFLTVNDGHLKVNRELQVRALNEYDYDTTRVLKSATPRLFHAEGFHTDTEYYVSLRRDFIYGANGITEQQKSVGTYLDTIAYTLNSTNDNYDEGDLFNVLSALDNENIVGGNIPDSDYGYSNGKGGYTYVSNYATQGALKALDQLCGSIYADIPIMSRQNTWLVQNHIADFLRPDFCLECNCCCGPINNGCGCGCDAAGNCSECEDNSCDCIAGIGHNVWGMYFGSFGDVKADGSAGDFNYRTNGFIIGGDLYHSHRTRLGFYSAYNYSSTNKKNLCDSGKTQSYNIGLYGVREMCFGNLIGSVGIARDNTKVDRLLQFGNSPYNTNHVNRMHRGELQSTQYNARLEQSWNYALCKTLFQPIIGVAYDHLQMSDLQECTLCGDRADGKYVTELRSDSYNLDSLRSDLGVRLSRCCTHGKHAYSIQGRAAWLHEYADTYAEITNSFTNHNYDVDETGHNNLYNTVANNAFNSDQFNACSYTIRGVDLGRDYVWGGAGLTYTNLCCTFSFFVAYDILANNQEQLHNVSGGAEFNW